MPTPPPSPEAEQGVQSAVGDDVVDGREHALVGTAASERAQDGACLPPICGQGGTLAFDGLRHSGLTWLADRGADVPTLMQISGHKSVRMLDRYHRDAAAAVRRLDEIDAPAVQRMTLDRCER